MGIAPIIAELLIGRGVVDMEAAVRLLRPSLDQMHDPALMLGMDASCQRASCALVENDESILIYW
ncbi:MAG: hypothetical protein WKF84_05335 [Pyrinomonadaceae bacterium]